MEKDYVVLIKDGNGSNRKLRLFLSPDDGDIYVSIVNPGDRLGIESVRVCTSQGDPSQGDINGGLREAFEAALNRGCGENHPFVDPEWESLSMRLFTAKEEISALKKLQEPLNPREHYNWSDFTIGEMLENNRWFCSNCDNPLDEAWSYCAACGQVIDWH